MQINGDIYTELQDDNVDAEKYYSKRCYFLSGWRNNQLADENDEKIFANISHHINENNNVPSSFSRLR